MNKIELFNSSLNTTRDDRHFRWKDYRHNVNSLLSSNFDKLEDKDLIVVIGAGRCDDFSLDLLVENFNKVVLTDVDLSSVKEAVDRYDFTKEERSKIFMERVEYTGLEKNQFFEDFEASLLLYKDTESIEGFIDRKLEDLDKYRFLKGYVGQANFVLVTPIYTQLAYQQVLLSCAKLRSTGYPENLLKFVEGYMGEKLVSIFETFNKNIVNALGDGYLFVLSDIFQDYSDSKFMIDVKRRIDSFSKMEELYETYQSHYGYGMGDLGLLILDEQVNKVDSKWLLWPFSKGVDLVVKFAIYKSK
ncbi:hypothetical protein RJG79_00950 [Mycoplasmatota bacterium WC44]